MLTFLLEFMTTRAVLSYIIHDNTGTNSEMIYYYRNIICFLLQSVPNNSIKPRHVWEWKQLLGLLRFSMWKISFNNLQQSTVLCNICKKTVSTKRGTHTHTFLLEKKQKNKVQQQNERGPASSCDASTKYKQMSPPSSAGTLASCTPYDRMNIT